MRHTIWIPAVEGIRWNSPDTRIDPPRDLLCQVQGRMLDDELLSYTAVLCYAACIADMEVPL